MIAKMKNSAEELEDKLKEISKKQQQNNRYNIWEKKDRTGSDSSASSISRGKKRKEKTE